jgi:transcriptional regulator with XRE-family HTH domain
MNDAMRGVAWDGAAGTAGGAAFACALRSLAQGAGLDAQALADAAGLDAVFTASLMAGSQRATPAQLARLAKALRLRAVEFMQKTNLLSLEVYALGLDPLYFLPEGQIRKDARIYMREINPRHAVPERDMLTRNPVLKALAADVVLDPLGKLETELTYLLRAAVQETGGTL